MQIDNRCANLEISASTSPRRRAASAAIAAPGTNHPIPATAAAPTVTRAAPANPAASGSVAASQRYAPAAAPPSLPHL